MENNAFFRQSYNRHSFDYFLLSFNSMPFVPFFHLSLSRFQCKELKHHRGTKENDVVETRKILVFDISDVVTEKQANILLISHCY